MDANATVPAVAPSRAAAWYVFARERFQLAGLVVLGSAQAASAQYVVGDRLDVVALLIATAGLIGLLATMRLMDELKDVEKDRIAHPERPLPRGLVTVPEARQALRVLVAALAVGAVVVTTTNPVAGGLFAGCVVYSLLMYREFFASRRLSARPFAYALSHQVVILPMYAFATAVAAPTFALSAPVVWFGLTGLGASFALEVCRKLDPEAHPILGTYLSIAGPGRTLVAAAAATLLTALASVPIDTHPFVWPAAGILLLALLGVAHRPQRFPLAAGGAALLVVVQILAPTLAHLTRDLR